MTNPPTRNILKNLFTSFIQSFRIRQLKGNFMGEDYFGNKYYEIPADPKTGKRKISRWFEPPEKENFEQEVTAEWEAWLRNRRFVKHLNGKFNIAHFSNVIILITLGKSRRLEKS